MSASTMFLAGCDLGRLTQPERTAATGVASWRTAPAFSFVLPRRLPSRQPHGGPGHGAPSAIDLAARKGPALRCVSSLRGVTPGFVEGCFSAFQACGPP